MEDKFSPSAIRRQLALILDDKDFASTEARRDFLKFIVDEALEGRGGRLKGVIIAQTVFGRDESFDQQNDPIVRLEARHLRSDLDRYYAGAGRWDTIRISIPKGGYAPRFDQQESQQPSPEDTLTNDPETTSNRPLPRRFLIGVSVAIVASLLLISSLTWYLMPSHDARSKVDVPTGPVIAVLPFLHLSGDPEREYFTQGITQQLTTELVRFRGLWVLPLGTIQRLSATVVDPQYLAEELGAEFVLEGSVLEKGDNLRITARLIDLGTGRYIWVRDYETDITPAEIYTAQEQIIEDVVGSLAGKYGLLEQAAMDRAKRKAPKSLDAYDCVLRYYDYQLLIDLEQHPKIKECLERATRADPNYSEAWAVLSNMYMQEVRYKLNSDPEQSFRNARSSVIRAIELDPESAVAHLMQANLKFSTGDIEGFRAAGETAISLNPNSSTVVAHYGMRLAFSGDWENGLALVERAKVLNPVFPKWFSFPEVFYLYHKQEYREALAVLETIDMPGFFWVPLFSAAIYGQLGDIEQAENAVQELLYQKPSFVDEALTVIQTWQLAEELNRQIEEGLRKAGLKI